MRRVLEARIPPALRRCLEVFFDEDLTSLRLFFFPYPADIAPVSPRAFSIGSSVFLADTTLQAPARQALFLLAHEVAHVVQRAGARVLRRHVTTTKVVLEREANTAAVAFLTGHPRPPLSPDPLPIARAWGPSGHYYTVYAVGRSAGLSDGLAEQLAFFAQMPDQVLDLDAIVAGEGFVVGALLTPALRKAAMRPSGMEMMLGTAESLHCLNGHSGGQESERRGAILKSIEDVKSTRGRFAFGLGLHALGDSFAHRTGDTDQDALYVAPFGHLFGGDGFKERVWKLGKGVDDISARRALYEKYCRALYELLRDRFAPVGPPSPKDRSSGDALATLAASVAAEAGEDKQIARLLAAFPGKASAYRPEKESPMPWQDFLRAHPKETAPWMQEIAQQLMKRWT